MRARNEKVRRHVGAEPFQAMRAQMHARVTAGAASDRCTISRNEANYPDEQYGADYRNDNRTDDAAAQSNAEGGHDPSANHGAHDTEDDIHDRTVSGTLHDSPSRPAGDEPHDDPPDPSLHFESLRSQRDRGHTSQFATGPAGPYE